MVISVHCAVASVAATKTAFLSSTNHELQTLLNAIIGFSEFRGSGVLVFGGGERHREFVMNIHYPGHHTLKRATNILEMAKLALTGYERGLRVDRFA